eukprot:1897458-Rhodomonas_salina.2
MHHGCQDMSQAPAELKPRLGLRSAPCRLPARSGGARCGQGDAARQEAEGEGETEGEICVRALQGRHEDRSGAKNREKERGRQDRSSLTYHALDYPAVRFAGALHVAHVAAFISPQPH